MNTWSFYRLADGSFTGRQYSGPVEFLEANTGADCGAIEGAHDHLCRRVDLASGEVVPYVPPAPAATAQQTWAWDDAAERWQAVPTLEALRQARIAPVQAAIEEREQQQARPVRELLEAMLAGQSPPAASQQAFESIRNAIGALQAARAAMAAAATQAELDAITWAP